MILALLYCTLFQALLAAATVKIHRLYICICKAKKREVTMQKNKTKKKYKKKAVAIKHNTITFFFTGLSSFLWRTYYYYSSVLTPPATLGLLLMIIEHDEIESY